MRFNTASLLHPLMGVNMMSLMRRRLSTEDRRAQLLAIGAELFGRRSYEDVSIEEVAESAHVSTGLLYHYFSSKRAFFIAIVEEEGQRLLKATTPEPTLAPLEQLRAGLQVYIEYAQQHASSYRVAQQMFQTDRDGSVVRESRTAQHLERILAGLSDVMTIDDSTRIAVSGWLAFVPAAILAWLESPSMTRDELCNVCVRALWAALGQSDSNGSNDLDTDHPRRRGARSVRGPKSIDLQSH
jgi:AcrR family transcriptional regulator